MRSRVLILLTFVIFTSSAFAKDVYLSIAGSVNNFRTDTRVFNPSFDRDITVQAYYLPVGNTSNANVQPISVTIPKRQMRVFDDVVTSLFSSTGLGAIRLVSANGDDFVATSRIYAQTATGTLGQFVPGQQAAEAASKGVLVQLKSNATFRTNIGLVNPNDTPATVTFRLYDKTNALVSTGTAITMPPYAVIGPTNMAGGFFFNASGFDLSDAWVSFTSDKPLFSYGSVIDNSTTDPTFIPMSADSGVATGGGGNEPPPASTNKTYTVTLKDFTFEFSPALDLKVGDQVTFNFVGQNSTHGFQLTDPIGTTLIPSFFLDPGRTASRTFTVAREGFHTYFCTNASCGVGHGSMSGTYEVKPSGPNPPPGRDY